MTTDLLKQLVLELLPPRMKKSPKGWLTFNAPCCVHNGETLDTRGRGGIIFHSDNGFAVHCFNCGFHSGWTPGLPISYKMRKWLAWTGADEGMIQRMVFDAIRIKDDINEELGVVVDEEAKPIVFEPRELPEDTKSLLEWNDGALNKNYLDVCNYIMGRGYDLEKYADRFAWSPSLLFRRSIILPFTWNDIVIGFTARKIDKEFMGNKYYTQYESDYVFNVDNQRSKAKFVLVTEGVFDALGINGVGILGSEISETQANIIDSLGKEVIVVPDNHKSSVSMVRWAIEYGWNVSFPFLEWGQEIDDPGHAFAKYGSLYTLKTILDNTYRNKFQIRLMARKFLGTNIGI